MMFNPYFNRAWKLRGGKNGELNISRTFVLFQRIADGNMNDKGNQYGMLTLPGQPGLADKLDDCSKGNLTIVDFFKTKPLCKLAELLS